MKRLLFIVIVLAVYAGSLVFKDRSLKAKSGEVRATIGQIINEKGIPVYSLKIKKNTFKQLIKVSGFIDKKGYLKSEVTRDVIDKIKMKNKVLLKYKNDNYSGEILSISKRSDIFSGLYSLVIKFEHLPVEVIGKISVAKIAYHEKSDAVTVPRSAVSLRYDKPFVFKINSENLIEKTLVKIADANDDIYLISLGLKEGDMIVISDFRGLSNGDRVFLATNEEN